MNAKTAKRLQNGLIFLALAVLAISFLFPIYYMAINSVKTKPQYRAAPFALPPGVSFANFDLLFRNFKIMDSFANTFIIAVASVAIGIVFGVVASYAFAKLQFKGKSVVYLLLIATMFIPAQVTMIPLYYLMSELHMVNKLVSVILTYVATTLPGTILLMTTSFSGISNEMIEAARIDGAGYFQIVRNVIVPMGMAVIAINIIFNFLSASNDLFTPMVLLQKIEKRTVMVALSQIMAPRNADPTYQMAGLLLSSLPQIAIYMIFSKFIIKGITVGSIK